MNVTIAWFCTVGGCQERVAICITGMERQAAVANVKVENVTVTRMTQHGEKTVDVWQIRTYCQYLSWDLEILVTVAKKGITHLENCDVGVKTRQAAHFFLGKPGIHKMAFCKKHIACRLPSRTCRIGERWNTSIFSIIYHRLYVLRIITYTVWFSGSVRSLLFLGIITFFYSMQFFAILSLDGQTRTSACSSRFTYTVTLFQTFFFKNSKGMAWWMQPVLTEKYFDCLIDNTDCLININP